MAASGVSQSMSTSVFIPAFAGYETRVRESFARQGAMRLIGATVGEVAPGYCAIELVPRPELSQQHGYVHAGIVSGGTSVASLRYELQSHQQEQ